MKFFFASMSAAFSITIFTSCAGPTDSARLAAKELKKKYSYKQTDSDMFNAEMWFMPLEAFELFVVGNDYDEEFTVEAFNKICSTKGALLPKDVVGKLGVIAEHAGNEGISACFARVITTQTPPFSIMANEDYNAVVSTLFKEVKKRGIVVPENYALSLKIDQENLASMFDYQLSLFYKLGHGASFGLKEEELAHRMKTDIDEMKLDFHNMGPFYEKDRVDKYFKKVSAAVKKYQSLKPFLERSCASKEEKHIAGCFQMKKRFRGFEKMALIHEQAGQHLSAKRTAFLKGNGVGGMPGRAIASEE